MGHQIHNFNFKCAIQVVFTVFSVVQPFANSRVFHQPRKIPIFIKQSYDFLQPWQLVTYFSLSGFAYLRHFIYIESDNMWPLVLTSFTSFVFLRFTYIVSRQWFFVPFYGRIIIRGMNRPHLLMGTWVVSIFSLLRRLIITLFRCKYLYGMCF